MSQTKNNKSIKHLESPGLEGIMLLSLAYLGPYETPVRKRLREKIIILIIKIIVIIVTVIIIHCAK